MRFLSFGRKLKSGENKQKEGEKLNNRISFDRDTSWKKETGNEQINFRFNIIVVIVYIIGIILIVQLFNLQVLNGETYREQSNTRLSRVTSIKSARGSIVDRTGTELAGIATQYSIEMYKTNIANEQLNTSILKLVNLLNEYQVAYTDTFPVNINPYEYTISGDELATWKAKYKIKEDATPEEAINKFKSKYEISNENIEDVRKIIAIRYKISTTG